MLTHLSSSSFCLPFSVPVKLGPKVKQLMDITQELVELLVCPACRAQVRLKPDGSALKCVSCRRVYAIRDGIPDMLVEHAAVEAEQPAPAS